MITESRRSIESRMNIAGSAARSILTFSPDILCIRKVGDHERDVIIRESSVFDLHETWLCVVLPVGIVFVLRSYWLSRPMYVVKH